MVGDININISSSALEKLIDYTASGIGAVAGSILARWQARQQGQARIITAEADATSARIIANAQAEARQTLIGSGEPANVTVRINSEQVKQRVEFQERKRLSNIKSVVYQAANELGDKAIPDHEPDHDWIARFFEAVQDVSSDDMQKIWARILAGEVEKPGRASIRTLSILRNLDQMTAELFQRFCSACVSLEVSGMIMDARVPSLGGNAAHNALGQYGFNFGVLNLLNEYGLVISDYNSWRDYQICIIPTVPQLTSLPFKFQGREWFLHSTTKKAARSTIKISGVGLTQSGREVSRVVDMVPMDQYAQALGEFFKRKQLQMIEINPPDPRNSN